MSFSPEFEVRPNKTQYVTQKDFMDTKRYILGTIDNKTIRATLRLNYSLNPNLSIQYYEVKLMYIKFDLYEYFQWAYKRIKNYLDNVL